MTRIESLINAVNCPQNLAESDGRQWESVLQLGRTHGISGRWYDQLQQFGVLDQLPASVEKNLWADRLMALENTRRVHWEADRVQHALSGLGVQFVLLKGGAYILLGLMPGEKRLVSDLDILVPFNRLDEVEAALKDHGWRAKAADDYDEHYYREWMHELPPMQHNVRGSWLDVHHNLVPRTSRACPSAASLLERIVPIPGTSYLALCPVDMTIHSILHGFYSGEFLNGFRDILDVHELITDLQAQHPSFWPDLITRADALKITRPVYYAVRYAVHFFNTEVPAEAIRTLSQSAPNLLSGTAMDFAVKNVISRNSRPGTRERIAARMLLARSHWLKMPPLMLAKHLSRKYAKRRELDAAKS